MNDPAGDEDRTCSAGRSPARRVARAGGGPLRERREAGRRRRCRPVRSRRSVRGGRGEPVLAARAARPARRARQARRRAGRRAVRARSATAASPTAPASRASRASRSRSSRCSRRLELRLGLACRGTGELGRRPRHRRRREPGPRPGAHRRGVRAPRLGERRRRLVGAGRALEPAVLARAHRAGAHAGAAADAVGAHSWLWEEGRVLGAEGSGGTRRPRGPGRRLRAVRAGGRTSRASCSRAAAGC